MAEKEKEEGLLEEVTERNIEHSLLKSRKIFLWSPVNDDSARAIVTRLLSLDAEDSKTEIVLYINRPGGSVSDGLAIYDAMQAIGSPVSTVCTGLAASMGAVLLAGGAKGRRFTWPHARIMIHQPLIMGTITGRATDLDIHAREMLKTREEINRLLASHTGQDLEKLAKDTDRDFYMSPQEAKDYGLIDDIVETSTLPKANGK